MPFLLFFQWWYGKGWINAFARVGERLKAVADELSLAILARTLFDPWKQIISYSGKGSSLEQKFRVWFDNVFARIVGFVIRFFTIILCLFAMALVGSLSLLLAIIWPLIPLAPLALIILGIG